MSRQFAHLHVHTEYSLLDGAAKIRPLLERAHQLGQPAIAVTDHGNMFGAAAFHAIAREVGITPILGIESYCAPASRYHKKPVFWGHPGQRSDDVSGRGAYTHMTLLAENATGLRNLFRLATRASEGTYKKSRIDRELLAEYHEGIIATTGCPSGEVQTRLRLGQPAEALQAAADYRDIFGAPNFFLELMDHGLDIERSVREGLLGIGRELNLTPLATNDSHYVTRDDAGVHDALLCAQTKTTLQDPGRFKFDGDGYYLKTAEEMRDLWDGEVPGACDTTLLIAERVQDYSEVFARQDLIPPFPVPEGHTQESWLRHEVTTGLTDRFPTVTLEHEQRVGEELALILSAGFASYFLIVADIVRWAKHQGIRVGPGRGSVTGSLVAYALRITELNPLDHGLLFARFLNAERVEMPDIDLDFDQLRRGEVLRYVTDRYGDDRVAQIITIGRMEARAAIKNAARILGFPYSTGDQIVKKMPPKVGGKDISLSAVTDPGHLRHREAQELRDALTDPDATRVMELARGLEGLVQQVGIHAAGAVLSSRPLVEVLPLWASDDGQLVTQWPMDDVERAGLVKMDFLGLRNLTVITDALNNIERAGKPVPVLESLTLDDQLTYELLARGDSLGVFQLDSPECRALLRRIAPTGFADISAVLALYRPGPIAAGAHIVYADRKHGRSPITPIHPELAEPLAGILAETYGLVIYQEQVMAIAQLVAGYTLGHADLLRKAMGKKKKEILDKEKVIFSTGMLERGYSLEAFTALWDILLPFSGYGFNKSHTAGYGLVSYWTAYLKTNYPSEYTAAVLTSVSDKTEKLTPYLQDCRARGLTIHPPDVNSSSVAFTPTGGGRVRYGLGAIHGLGDTTAEAIVTARGHTPFRDFWDFLDRVPATVCGKKTVEALILAGAFDSLKHPRKGLYGIVDLAVKRATIDKHVGDTGQDMLFTETAGTGHPTIPAGEWSRESLLRRERESLGGYMSDHPLAGLEHILEANTTTTIVDLPATQNRAITVGGLITDVTTKVSAKTGGRWAKGHLEDHTGGVEIIVFPRTYEDCGELAKNGSLVIVTGRAQPDREEDNTLTFIVDDIRPLDQSAMQLVVDVDAVAVTTEWVTSLKELLTAHPGDTSIKVRVHHNGGHSEHEFPQTRAHPNRELHEGLRRLGRRDATPQRERPPTGNLP